MIINKIVTSSLIYSMILYVIAKYIPQLWFTIEYNWGVNLEIIFVLWLIFFAVNDIAKWLLKLLALPVIWLTLWLARIFISVWVIYLFKYLIWVLNVWVIIELWTPFQVLIMSVVIYVLNLIFKKL